MPKDYKYPFGTDANGIPVAVGDRFSVQDAAETPITSPVTIAPAATQKITLPENAAEILINCDNDVLLALDSDFTAYDRILGRTKEPIGVAGLTEVQVKNDNTSSIAVFFRLTLM